METIIRFIFNSKYFKPKVGVISITGDNCCMSCPQIEGRVGGGFFSCPQIEGRGGRKAINNYSDYSNWSSLGIPF